MNAGAQQQKQPYKKLAGHEVVALLVGDAIECRIGITIAYTGRITNVSPHTVTCKRTGSTELIHFDRFTGIDARGQTYGVLWGTPRAQKPPLEKEQPPIRCGF